MIGASPKRKEDRRLLVGAGLFVDDVARPGLLHLGVVRSAEAHARLVTVDAGAARGRAGVVAAWTAADLPEVAAGLPEGYGAGYKGRPFVVPVIARARGRHVGEPVAVVVADDAARLADAMEAVTVEYAALPAVSDPETALASPTRLHEGWADNSSLPVGNAIGDAPAAMAGADVVVEARVRHPRLCGMAIETRATLAYLDEADALVVVASMQNPYLLRDTIATTLGLPSERVRVVTPDVGGAFGPKGSVYQDHLLVAAAALRLRRPVKHVETRREHLVATGHDREQVHHARLGLARDGAIVALEDRFVADVGAYPVEGDGLTMNTVNHLPGPYRVPHYRCAGQSVVTNKTQNAAYRGAGRPEAALVMERLMDMGARRLGLDPAELRRRNLVRPAEMPYRSGLTYKDGVPVTYDPGDFPAALERALALIDYDGWRSRQRERRGAGGGARRLGIGLACYAQGTGLGPYEGATVRVDPSGKVYVLIGVAGQGQGHATTLAQICAESLGAPVADVEIVAGDTAVFPFGMGTGGSRVIANTGPAVARAASEVRARASRVAAEVLECAPEDVRIADGRATVAGVPDRGVGLGRLAHVAIKSRALRGAVGEPGLNACVYFQPETVTWAFGTHAAVVEVDVETCASRLLAYAVVHDPGRAINPVIVEGQLQGGAVQGLAAGLLEELVYDPAGQLLTGSLMDYAIPRADDLPPIPVALTEHRSVINELGVKGVGESGAIPGAAAIANAIEDAVADLGVVVGEVPVTGARLFALLSAARRA